MYRIVVGVDGSEEAQRAVEWALEEAQLRRGSVSLVYSYEVPIAVGPYRMGVIDPTILEEQAREDAERRMEKILAGFTAPEGVEVSSEVVAAMQPAHALLQRARDADLLVLGSRGRGGFSGLLLGSVSQHCTHHAVCPVVVVR